MARPTKITDDLLGLIQSERRPGMTARQLHARLQHLGANISASTLRRHLRQADEVEAPAEAEPEATPDPAAVVLAGEAEALLADDTTEFPVHVRMLVEAQGKIAAAMKEWEPWLGRDRSAVLSYTALARASSALAKEIAELTPRPEADRYRGLGEAVKDELIVRAERARVAVDADAARGRAYDKLLEAGKLVIAD